MSSFQYIFQEFGPKSLEKSPVTFCSLAAGVVLSTYPSRDCKKALPGERGPAFPLPGERCSVACLDSSCSKNPCSVTVLTWDCWPQLLKSLLSWTVWQELWEWEQGAQALWSIGAKLATAKWTLSHQGSVASTCSTHSKEECQLKDSVRTMRREKSDRTLLSPAGPSLKPQIKQSPTDHPYSSKNSTGWQSFFFKDTKQIKLSRGGSVKWSPSLLIVLRIACDFFIIIVVIVIIIIIIKDVY